MQAWGGGCFGGSWLNCKDLVGDMAELAWGAMGGHWLLIECALVGLVSWAGGCRNRRGGKETVAAWLLSHLLPRGLL